MQGESQGSQLAHSVHAPASGPEQGASRTGPVHSLDRVVTLSTTAPMSIETFSPQAYDSERTEPLSYSKSIAEIGAGVIIPITSLGVLRRMLQSHKLENNFRISSNW